MHLLKESQPSNTDRQSARWRTTLPLLSLTVFFALGCIVFSACGDTQQDVNSIQPLGGGGDNGMVMKTRCVDLDHDGYGRGCDKGEDCDDRIAYYNTDCGGTNLNPCNPGASEACYSLSSLGGSLTLQCSSGTRTCGQDGHWGACSVKQSFARVLAKPLAQLITGPVTCNPCDPACNLSTDYPDNTDLNGGNSDTGLHYEPGAGGLVLIDANGGTYGSGGGAPADTDGDSMPDDWDDFPADPTKDGITENGGLYHILPYLGPAVSDPLEIDVQAQNADVYFLMDTTATMQGEIDNLKAALTTGDYVVDPSHCPTFAAEAATQGIIGAIRCEVPDVYFGVGYHDDFPLPPHGDGDYSYDTGNDVCYDAATDTHHDVPYYNLLNVSPVSTAGERAAVTGAVDKLVAKCGGRIPESQVTALYSIATGLGIPDTRYGWPFPSYLYTPTLYSDSRMQYSHSAYLHETPGVDSDVIAVTLATSDTTANAKDVGDISVHSKTVTGINTSTFAYADDFSPVGCDDGDAIHGGASPTAGARDAVLKFSVSVEDTYLFEANLGTAGFEAAMRVIKSDGTSMGCGEATGGWGFDHFKFGRPATGHSHATYKLPVGAYFLIIDGFDAADKGKVNYVAMGRAYGDTAQSAIDFGDVTTEMKGFNFSGGAKLNRFFDDRVDASPCFGDSQGRLIGDVEAGPDYFLKFTVSSPADIMIYPLGEIEYSNYDWAWYDTLELYDSSFALIECNGGGYYLDQSKNAIYKHFEPGTYYIVVRNTADWSGGDVSDYVIGPWPGTNKWITPPQTACASGQFGYPCFRENTIPVVVEFTDALMHNMHDSNLGDANQFWTVMPGFIGYNDGGISGSQIYSPNRESIIRELLNNGVKYIGINSGDDRSTYTGSECIASHNEFSCANQAVCDSYASSCTTQQVCEQSYCWYQQSCTNVCTSSHIAFVCANHDVCDAYGMVTYDESWTSDWAMRYIATQTGTTDASGEGMVYHINDDGTGLSTAVVNAIVNLMGYSRMSIVLRINDNTGTAIDERGFIDSVTAVPTAETDARCLATHSDWFEKCLPGTKVKFQVTFRNDIVMPAAGYQVFNFSATTLGDGIYTLATTPIRIVVPPLPPSYPPSGQYWRDYTSVCPGTQRPDWSEFAWTNTINSGTSIRFEAQTSNVLADVPTSTVVSWTSPATSSPVDVGELLMAAGISNNLRYLRIKAVLLSSADGTETPLLQGFELKYYCVDND